MGKSGTPNIALKIMLGVGLVMPTIENTVSMRLVCGRKNIQKRSAYIVKSAAH